MIEAEPYLYMVLDGLRYLELLHYLAEAVFQANAPRCAIVHHVGEEPTLPLGEGRVALLDPEHHEGDEGG